MHHSEVHSFCLSLVFSPPFHSTCNLCIFKCLFWMFFDEILCLLTPNICLFSLFFLQSNHNIKQPTIKQSLIISIVTTANKYSETKLHFRPQFTIDPGKYLAFIIPNVSFSQRSQLLKNVFFVVHSDAKNK